MNSEKTYHIITFGCQMNERDSETLAGMLEELGYEKNGDRQAADVVVLNTCSVRDNADKRFYGVLGQLKKAKEKNPGKIIALCGCMMQQETVRKNIHRRYPWVDIIFGTLNIGEFPKLLCEALKRAENLARALPAPAPHAKHRITESVLENAGPVDEGLPASRLYPFKAFVNITYGCNNFCTYCIVPYTRGRERSRTPEAVLRECRELAAAGTKEIMFLGQNVNSYGRSELPGAGYRAENGLDFAGLLREADKIDGIERIRFMTSHPKDISDELIQCFADCKHLCKVLHLPVQSGSNEILRRMNRRYTREDYLAKVEKLRAVCPEIALTTDIIVGFPGESEKDFEDTLELVRRVRYDSAFTFIYSRRSGTPADRFPDQIPPEISHERFKRLTDAIHEIQEEKSRAYQGKILPVLVEGRSKTDAEMLTGRTESGMTVDFPGSPGLVGKIIPVEITKAQTFSLYGQPRPL